MTTKAAAASTSAMRRENDRAREVQKTNRESRADEHKLPERKNFPKQEEGLVLLL